MLRNASESPKTNEVRPWRPCTVPFTRVAIAFGTALLDACRCARGSGLVDAGALEPRLPVRGCGACLLRDLISLGGDAADDEHGDHSGDRSERQQDERGACRPRHAMTLQTADSGHADRRDDRRRDEWPDDREGLGEQPDDRGDECETADQEPRGEPEIAQPGAEPRTRPSSSPAGSASSVAISRANRQSSS